MLLQLIEGQKRTDERLVKMENDISNIKNDVSDLKKDVRYIKIDLENHVDKMLSELTGRQIDDSERLQSIEKEIQDVKDDLVASEVIQGIKANNLM